MTALKNLSFMYSEVETLPDAICEMDQLREIWCSYNPVKRLPPCIKDMKNLKHLVIYNVKMDTSELSLLKKQMGGRAVHYGFKRG
jgi:Leucine-rich repeat (LRR) protein